MLPIFKVKQSGFTLVELLVAIIVSSILITSTISTYSLFRRSLTQDQARSDVAQSGRVAMERLTRDIRQTPTIVTDMPADPSDNSVAEPNELEFEDGNAEDLSYRRYYLSGTTLKLQTKDYHFLDGSGHQTGSRVPYDQVDGAGHLPTATVLSDQDISYNITSFAVYGYRPLSIYLTISDPASLQTYKLRTSVTGRNI